MAISKVNQPIARFDKGIITEVSPLNYPENASLDEINFKLHKDGTRDRRLGLDLEEGYVYVDTGLSNNVIPTARVSSYRWVVPNGHFEYEIGVIQIGNALWFIDLLTESPSANVLNGGVPLTAVGIRNDYVMEFATINNYLVGISRGLESPYLFSYDPDTDIISYETARITIRDLYGVDDGLAVSARPTTLSNEHKYNLRNQGWNSFIETTCGVGVDALDCTYNTFGLYPSNSDQWVIGRIADLTNADVDKYDPNLAKRNIVDYGQVPKGHFIIDLFNRGSSRTSESGITLPNDRELTYVSTIATFAGRVWYSGIYGDIQGGDNRSLHLSNAVLYSQVFTDKINLVKCYQEADPTSWKFNKVVDTDGGVIHIPGCSLIFKIKQIKQSLFVFALNGIWEISGDAQGFRATSFQVKKICSVGVYSKDSVEEVDGIIYFWGSSGIYAVIPNDQGTYDVRNLTLNSIQRIYNEIPDSSKNNARVLYDEHTNSLRWLYYSPYDKEVGVPIETGTLPKLGETTNISVDCYYLTSVVLNATTYVFIYSDVATGDLKGVVCTLDAIDSTVVTMGPVNTLNSSGNWTTCFSIERYSDSEVIIIGKPTVSGQDIWASLASVSGTTITAGVFNLIATEIFLNDTYNHTPYIRYIEPTKYLVGFPRQASPKYLGFAVLTVTDSSTMSLGTISYRTTGSFVSEGLGIISTGTANQFYASHYSGTYKGLLPVTVSGNTVSIGVRIESTLLLSTSNSDNYRAFSKLNTNEYILSRQVGGSSPQLAVYNIDTNTTTNYTYPTTEQSADGTVIATTNDRFAFLWRDWNNGNLKLDYFQFANSTITRYESSVVDTDATSWTSYAVVDIPRVGFTSTKFPAVYHADYGGTSKISTFVFDMGSI